MNTKYMRAITLLLTLPLLIFAEEGDEEFSTVGTTAAQFLKVEVGARALAMGGAFGAVGNDATALYWNPAGIASLNRYELSITHTQWIANLAHDFIGFVFPLGPNQALGLSAIFQNTDEIEVTTIDEPRGTGEMYDVSDLAAAITYARAMTEFIRVGITTKYIQQVIWHETARTVGFDFGMLLDTGFPGLRLAMAMMNYGGSMQLAGRDLIRGIDQMPESVENPNVEVRLRTEAWPLPTNFRISLAMSILGNEALFASGDHHLTTVFDATHPNDGPEHYNGGVEYSFRNQIFYRVGYRGNSDEEGLTMGGGLKMPISSTVHLIVDYAYADFGVFSSVQHFTLGFTF